MDHPRAVNHEALIRLQTLTANLSDQIAESQDVRARLARALDTAKWPDVSSAWRRAPPAERWTD